MVGRGRVLFLTGEYPPLRGGIGDYVAQLGKSLQKHGWTVEVVTRTLPTIEPDVPPLYNTVTNWGRPLWRTLRSLRRSGWAGIVHVQYQTGAFDFHPFVNLIPLFAHSFPVVTTFHDTRVPYLFPKAGHLRIVMNQLLAQKSRAVIVTNPEDREILYHWGIPVHRLKLIPIGSNLPSPRDPASWRARLSLPSDQPLIAFFGFRTHEKGLDTLVTALEMLSDRRPVLLLLGGDIPDTDRTHRNDVLWFQRRLAETTVKVVDLGFQPAQVASDLLATADLVVLPFREGASLRNGTLVAALTCGAAVITTRPSSPEHLSPLRDGEHLLLVPPNDPTSLAQAIDWLSRNPERRQALRQAAQAVARVFAWERIALEHEELYQALLE